MDAPNLLSIGVLRRQSKFLSIYIEQAISDDCAISSSSDTISGYGRR